MDDGDFLFTWKPDRWPHANLRALVDRFQAGEIVVVPWRCQAYRQARPGSRGYLYKQGASPRGVFGVAEVVGPAEERDGAAAGEARFAVPLRFTYLVDPAERFIVSEHDLQSLPAPPHRWSSQASGVALEAEVARAIDALAGIQASNEAGKRGFPELASPAPATVERITEAYVRNQALIDELKAIYDGRCQICDSRPFNGYFGSICEGHHIQWLCRDGRDELNNLILLCPNHHSAVHSADPFFDRKSLTFHFGPKIVPIRLNRHLIRE